MSEILLQRAYHVLPDILFDGWTKPDLLQKWFFQHQDCTVEIEMSMEEGGGFNISEMCDNIKKLTYVGRYLVIEKPWKLVFELTASDLFDGTVLVTLDMAPGENKTTNLEMRLSVSPAQTQINWNQLLERLALVLEYQ